MRAGLVVSATLHVGLIVLAVVGLGAGRPLDPAPVDSIAVDLVPISEFSNIRMGTLDSTIVETETPSTVASDKPPELAQPTGNTSEDQAKPADNAKVTPAPTEQTAPTPEAAMPPVPDEPQPADVAEVTPPVEPPDAETPPTPTEDQPLVSPDVATDPADSAPKPAERTDLKAKRAAFKKAQEAKKAEEQKKKDQDKKQAEEKKLAEKKAADAKKLADEVANIINDEQSRGATTGEGGEPTLGKETGKAATLSQSELDGLVAQIKSCISLPPGAEDANITAQLEFSIDASGMVSQTPRIVGTPASALEQAYAGAAQRAVMRCGPYQVKQQDVRATFTPVSY
jgi:colicin import membrane protein